MCILGFLFGHVMSFCIMQMSCGAYFIHTQQETCHIMPYAVACAVNAHDIMHRLCDMHTPATQTSLSICDVPKYAYWHGVHMC